MTVWSSESKHKRCQAQVFFAVAFTLLVLCSTPCLGGSIKGVSSKFKNTGNPDVGTTTAFGAGLMYNAPSASGAETFFLVDFDLESYTAPVDEESADTIDAADVADVAATAQAAADATQGTFPKGDSDYNTTRFGVGAGRRIFFGPSRFRLFPYFFVRAGVSYTTHSFSVLEEELTANLLTVDASFGPGVRVPFSEALFLDFSFGLIDGDLYSQTSSNGESQSDFGFQQRMSGALGDVTVGLGYDLDGQSGVGHLTNDSQVKESAANRKSDRRRKNKGHRRKLLAH